MVELTIPGLLARAERDHAPRRALVDRDLHLNYGQLADLVRAMAAALLRAGVGRGDRVAILDHNSPAFLVAYFAVPAVGGVLCPLNVRLSDAELCEVLVDAGARVLLCGSALAPLGEQVREGLGGAGCPLRHLLDADTAMSGGERAASQVAVAPDDLAQLYYTSGTTGRPKGVMLTHRNVCAHALAAVGELDLGRDDVWGHFAPMFHLADAWATFAITWVGGTHVMSERFEPAAALALLRSAGITVTNLVPTMLNLMVKHPEARALHGGSLRLMLSGGAPIAPEVVRQVIETLGCEYAQTYGMTETSPYLTLSRLDARHEDIGPEARLALRARTGRPFATVDLEVVDDRGLPVAPDDRSVGEIRVRGETVSPGYWNRPEETAAAFRDGWLYTGDLAVIDEHGFVNIVDRRKDTILTGGENVYSVEVENVLYEHPGVLECAVFGLPDARWGEAVCAAVVPRPGTALTAEGVADSVRSRIAGYKVPKRVFFLEALPRTGSGKISKRALREQFAPGAGGAAS